MNHDEKIIAESKKRYALQAERDAFLDGVQYCEDNPAWRMCEDEMLTDPHQSYWVYAKCCGECCVAYIQEKTKIFYDEGGEELSGVVAWLPLPMFNLKDKKE
jgi:hypothetical protein